MKLTEIKTNKQIVVCYPGRFQPFHKGHKKIYDWLKSKFNSVFIVTSDSVDPPRSPFGFEDKKKMMMFTGVDEDDIVQVKSPYRAIEVTENYNEHNTVLIYAVSEKDMQEDPRFNFAPKKDGSPSYFQPLQNNPEPLTNHAYILTVPVVEFTINDQPIDSSTQIRDMFGNASKQEQAKIILDLYGRYDNGLHKLFYKKILPKLEESLAHTLSAGWEKLKGTKAATTEPEDFDSRGLLKWFEAVLSEWKASGRLTKRIPNLVNPYWPSDYLYARALKAGADRSQLDTAWEKFRSSHPDLWKGSKMDQVRFNIQRTPTSLRHPNDLFEDRETEIIRQKLMEQYQGT